MSLTTDKPSGFWFYIALVIVVVEATLLHRSIGVQWLNVLMVVLWSMIGLLEVIRFFRHEP